MNLKTHLTLLLGVLIGVTLCQAFKGCSSSDETIIHYPVQTTSEAKKEFEKKEQKLLVKEDSLKKHGTDLKKELVKAKHSLQQLKETNSFLKAQLLNLLDKNIEADSSGIIKYTDILKNKVNEFIDNCDQKDSSYQVLNGNFEMQVNNKDSVISIQTEKYAELKLAFEKSNIEKGFLTEENNQLKKQFKRQKVKRRFLSALMLIASGTAAGILLHH